MAMDVTAHMAGWDTHDRSSRFGGLAFVIALHVAVIWALLQYEPARSALAEAVPIMVSLITPQPVVEKPRVLPKPLPVKPRPATPAPPVPQQIIAAAPTAPEPALAPTPPPPAPAPVIAAPPPAPVPAVATPVVPPSFSASYLENPAPAYPPLSRRVGEQGKVMLRVLVNAKGTADTVELRSSSGSSRLDDAAVESVKHWRFVPARQGDLPVAAWVLVPITFSLKG
jgi:protein TonB